MGVVDTKHMLDDPPKNINQVKAYHDLCARTQQVRHVAQHDINK